MRISANQFIAGLTVLVSFWSVFSTSAQTVHYVNVSGTCGGQTPCYTSIQTAVNTAASGDTIRLATGSYGAGAVTIPTSGLIIDIPSGATGFSFTLNAGIAKLQLMGAGAVNVTGNDAVNSLTGNDGVNNYNSKKGADTIYAEGGNDVITADMSWTLQNQYNYRVDGGSGVDQISGQFDRYEWTFVKTASPAGWMTARMNYSPATIMTVRNVEKFVFGAGVSVLIIGAGSEYTTINQAVTAAAGTEHIVALDTNYVVSLTSSIAKSVKFYGIYRVNSTSIPTDGTATSVLYSFVSRLGPNIYDQSSTPVLRTPAATVSFDTTGMNANQLAAVSSLCGTFNTINVGSISGNQTLCSSANPASFTSVSAASGTGTITYQWQQSSDDINYTDIAGATSATYDSGPLSSDTWFRRVDISTLNGVQCTANTNSVKITILLPIPTVSITNNTGSTVVTCLVPSISLSASGGSNYNWSSSLGTSATVSVSNSGTYSVTNTDANGCTASASLTITKDVSTVIPSVSSSTSTYVLSNSSKSIVLTASGGTAYNWSGGLGTSAAITVNAPGSYSVTNTGTNGCTATYSFDVIANTFQGATDTTQIGTYSSTNSNYPIRASTNYSYSQQVYTKAELNTAGISGRSHITKLRFYCSSVGSNIANSSNWTVYLKNQSSTNLGSSFESVTGLTQVFRGTISITSGWFEIVLQQPFLWDGSSNLLVAVDENASGLSGTTSFGVFSLSALSYRLLYRTSATDVDPATHTTSTSQSSTSRNSIQFSSVSNSACSGTPTPGVLSSNNACLIQPGTADLTLSGFSTGGGLSLQWQESSDSATWNDISGANLFSTYTTPVLSASHYYRCKVTCDSSSLSAYSNALKVSYLTTPIISAPSNVSVAVNNSGCTATGVSLGSPDVSQNCSGYTVTNDHASTTYPSGVTTVTWTITDSLGRTATSVQTVTVSSSASASITNNTGSTDLTCSRTSISLTGVSGVGGVSYSWSNGSSVVGANSSLAVTAAGTYTLTVTDNNGCTASESMVITSSMPVFSITGTNTPSACNPKSYSVQLRVTGGTPPYTSQSEFDYNGDFIYTVTDQMGCRGTGVFPR